MDKHKKTHYELMNSSTLQMKESKNERIVKEEECERIRVEEGEC